MRDWVGLSTTYSVSPRQGAHGIHLREGRAPPCRTVRRTRAPWSPSEPRHVPVVHAERGREERTARPWLPTAHMRIPHRAWRARARPSLHHCMLLAVRHGVTVPKPNPPMPACERDVHAGWVRGSRTGCGCRPRS